MRAQEFVNEKWTQKYKKSINCSSPKGFSQKAHCAGRKKNEGVAEGLDAEAYKQKLLASLPGMMKFFAKNVKGWKPSEEQMLAAIETGYTVMKHTGDVKQAGRAVMDELNTLHRMSQGQQDVVEAFDQPYKLKWERGDHGDWDALARLDDGTYLSIMFNLGDQIEDRWMVEFYRNNSQEVTGEGDAQRVFATVLTAVQQFIKKKKPESLFFSAVKENDPTGSRTKLYDRLVQRYANGLGYNLQKEDYPEQTGYRLTKVKQGVAENFHDGKKPGRKGLAQALTQSLIKQELQESISRTVYHYTGLIPALKILQSGEFQLSGALGSVEQQYAPKGYPYFFSTTRTRRGGYHDMVGKGGVLFVLDGNWFNQRYPGAPIDYFLNRSPTATHRPHEAEDRVFSRDATIPINGVRAIHVYVSPVAEPEQRATARQLMILAKRAGIPVSLYRNAEAWRNFDSRNTADVGQLQGQERTGGRVSTHPGYLLPWIQLLTARDKSQLNKDADKIRYSLAYTYNREDAARGLSTDLSNARKPNSGPDREHAVKIIQFMRKNNLDTVKDLIAVLAQKWQPEDKKVEENFADGKIKGKSRPGRVKRAGASCDGSVTDLRQHAKNASGEQAKMYHWCANMKSGKK